jgi:hypothetical protein
LVQRSTFNRGGIELFDFSGCQLDLVGAEDTLVAGTSGLLIEELSLHESWIRADKI